MRLVWLEAQFPNNSEGLHHIVFVVKRGILYCNYVCKDCNVRTSKDSIGTVGLVLMLGLDGTGR